MPIIDTDWWEPIYSVDTENVIGQVQILVALGTEDQINNLKAERGFVNKVVKANDSAPLSRFEKKAADKLSVRELNSRNKFRYAINTRDFVHLKNESKYKYNDKNSDLNKVEETRNLIVSSRLEEKDKSGNFVDKAVNTLFSPKEIAAPSISKSDVGTQSGLEMDKMVDTQDKNKISPTQEMLGNFLNQLMAGKQKNIFVENSTNTEAVETVRSNCSQSLQDAQNNTNLKLRRTTDLLDSLQKALSLDSVPHYKSSEKKTGNIFQYFVSFEHFCQ